MTRSHSYSIKATRFERLTLLVFFALACQSASFAQDRATLPDFLFDPTYRGNRTNEKKSVSAGNRIRITFFNTGLLGGIGEVRGEWPAGSEDNYIGDVLPVVAYEVPVDLDGDAEPDTLVRRVVTVRGPRAGTTAPLPGFDKFFGFEAMAGFAREDGTNSQPAISTDPTTWPQTWPDHPDWKDGRGEPEWNGFFGRGIINADFETYYWMDDQQDDRLFTSYGFLPDTTDETRRGQGIAIKTRGLQWSQFLAQDAMFWVYEVTNTSTTTYPRVAVGLTVGTLAGGDGDSQDDMAFFDQANRIVYSYDFDNSGNRQQPVGIAGYAFMESPGNDLDGIDNDGDGDPNQDAGLDIDGFPFVTPGLEGVDNIFIESDFQPRTLSAGDPLILIDGETFERTITYLGSGPMTVESQGRTYNVAPGTTLQEREISIRGQLESITVTEKNLIDDDLDGLIDEDIFLHFTRRAQNFQREIITLPSLRFKDYVAFAAAVRGREPTRADSVTYGLANPMIDEAGNDGLDNDNDWNPLTDDVGGDGRSGTGDAGEGDGRPTPGEPNFDALDVDETDQVGLASFFYFTPPGALVMNRDELMWERMTPGFFTTNAELDAQQSGGGVDGDFLFGSGYFRLEPGETLRFSMALVFGGGETFATQLANITNNVITIQEIYDRNYQFAKPPDKPTLSGVPGDKKVTLFWDSIAEESIDPILGKDFQGYKIYRSTDPFFRDPLDVTDAAGNPRLLAPMAQFDLNDGLEGLWVGSPDVYQRVAGVPFNLGGDSGLRYAFVDDQVENGREYFYAVTAYDRGSTEFYPAENNFPVTIAEDGSIKTDRNVVRITPNAPVLGFQEGGVVDDPAHVAGPATGDVFVETLDARLLGDEVEYVVEFAGSAVKAGTFNVTANGQPLISGGLVSAPESYIFDGMRIALREDDVRLNADETDWTEPEGKIPMFVGVTNVSQWRYTGVAAPFDYRIEFSDVVQSTSIGGFTLGSRGPAAVATDCYFSLVNVTENRPASFVFYEPDPAIANGRFDGNEFIFIYETLGAEAGPTWAIRIEGSQGAFPVTGDVFELATFKPFTNKDRYSFRTRASAADAATAQEQLDRIRVVPNPYLAAASWEGRLPPTITSGRGERRVDFTHLPAQSRITIYNARGELVRELVHESDISDGSVSWDLKSREQLDIAFGVYFYHVDAPGIGETTGKLAIIK